ncbi:MAG: DUF3322 domain-containing protein [Anaerobiospirillum succiniciproducens]|uniref:DUF3322 domain-containing protein n=1 Tax=Anaerobiospirillum succiniciproducens TaxID=13335 RepID=UPI00041D74AF|nr:DUF3322 domain-containing protein [Anaerobiospirillum succiniciproducens]MCI6863987.1 DUF3322 domain-containing protein [Anaerobiospirillum succiniciproducens]MDY2798787.1 DUF3322 domain-containing protein [Anaerobiospirillum succiniciproducens]
MKNRSIIRSEINNYYRAKVISWLASHVKDKRDVPEDFPTHLYLGAPTKDEDVLESKDAFLSFCKEWSAPLPAGHIEFIDKTYPDIGTVKVPIHLVFDTPEELATWAGHLVEYHSSVRCLDLIAHEMPELIDSALNVISSLANLAWIDFERMVAVCKWFCENRNSRLLTRQIPIRGIDTRWFEIHTPLLLDFLRDYLELNPYRKDLLQLGLVPPPALIRLVIFDAELRAKVGGLKIVAASISELNELNLRPERIVFMDNLPTAVALPDIKGTIGIITPFHHVRETCRINWVAQAHCQYLGSVDLRSFAVLHNLRLYLPNIESVLMDEQTLLSNQDLWTNDDVSGFDSAPVALNQAESHLYGCLIDGVYGDHVRLDLERLPLALIATALGADDEQAASLAREAELYSNVGNNYQNNAAKPTPANDAAASGQ